MKIARDCDAVIEKKAKLYYNEKSEFILKNIVNNIKLSDYREVWYESKLQQALEIIN